VRTLLELPVVLSPAIALRWVIPIGIVLAACAESHRAPAFFLACATPPDAGPVSRCAQVAGTEPTSCAPSLVPVSMCPERGRLATCSITTSTSTVTSFAYEEGEIARLRRLCELGSGVFTGP
jgi:hypothetical protein